MGTSKTNQTVTGFWYRRLSEVALLICITITALFVAPLFGVANASIEPFIVELQTAIIAVTAIVAAGLSFVIHDKRSAKLLTVVVVTCLSAAILSAMRDTGELASPFVALWVMASLFAAVAGIASFVAAASCVALYGLYLLLGGSTTISDWLFFGFVLVAPLLIGLFIWLRRFNMQSQSSQAVTELASELDQEANKSSIIINSITDGVLLVDTSGIVQLINPAAETVIGWGSQDAANLDYRSVLKLVTNKDETVEPSLDPIQECLRTGESVMTDTLSVRTTSGKKVAASIMVSPLSGDAGAVVVFRDITAKRAEERDQAEFVSTASHEMRTPVAAIEGYLGLALNPQTATIDEKARTYLLKAQESAKHLGRLFQDLLDISKIEDGRLESELTIINIPSFVRELLEDFRGQVTEKSLTLIYAPDTSSTGKQTVEPLLYAMVDQSHLQEVLSNLIGNAIKYTKEGSVTVDVTSDNDHVFVSVADTGIGIPAEDIPHLFQKFYRVDNTDTREIGGTGLGLYLARRLIETMRGHLNVTSTYGSGSTFSVELPRISKEQAEQPSLSIAAPDQSSSSQVVAAAPIASPSPNPPTADAQPSIQPPSN